MGWNTCYNKGQVKLTRFDFLNKSKPEKQTWYQADFVTGEISEKDLEERWILQGKTKPSLSKSMS